MLKLRELKPNVWELTLTGVLEKGDIATMERELTPALQGDGPLGLIVRAEEWKDITADAMAEDAKFEFGMLAQWSKIAKMAVVTDLQAAAALLKWMDPILPMIDMKAFGSADVAAAEAFAFDLPLKEPAAAGAGVKLLSDGADGVIAYEIDGRITAEDVDSVLTPLEAHMKGDEKINLLVRFKDFDGFDPAILTNGSLMGTKMKAITHLRRYAVVGAPTWMAAMAGTVAGMLPFEMRMFDGSEDAAAWAWVRAV
ncbi:STAS/SEC14 domain-containing protein [Primorskyibacter flagellatus]|uniref:SpoIIAA-like n=1 Tax=Primorskyibacter flagellatus TaxID=1387277 RepID=A0A1W2DEP1_9RHOB|nr:STAS/SEC14 domain-containing protein [Primorskyibacter flagellatus]SMC95526.1 SpoIIAA-like [Primorskyibacter flagellatus]